MSPKSILDIKEHKHIKIGELYHYFYNLENTFYRVEHVLLCIKIQIYVYTKNTHNSVWATCLNVKTNKFDYVCLDNMNIGGYFSLTKIS